MQIPSDSISCGFLTVLSRLGKECSCRTFCAGKYAPQSILAIKTLALTGCRSSEITSLELDELDLENGYLRLNKRKTDAFNVPLGDPSNRSYKTGIENM